MKDLSIVIPALNEAENLSVLFGEIKSVLVGKNISYEVIVVDGGSKDSSEEIVKSNGARFLRQSKPGYGGALKEGFRNSDSDFIVTLDADLSHDPSVILNLYGKRDEAELIIASRYVRGGGADMGGFRKLLSVILNTVYSKILSLPYKDISSGFRLYNRKALEKIKVKAVHFDVLEEVLIRMHCNKWRVMEVPFYYRPRLKGASHAKLVKFGYHFLRTLFRMIKLSKSRVPLD